MPDSGGHATNLAIHPFMQRDFEPGRWHVDVQRPGRDQGRAGTVRDAVARTFPMPIAAAAKPGGWLFSPPSEPRTAAAVMSTAFSNTGQSISRVMPMGRPGVIAGRRSIRCCRSSRRSFMGNYCPGNGDCGSDAAKRAGRVCRLRGESVLSFDP